MGKNVPNPSTTKEEVVIKENAQSVAGRPLPPVPKESADLGTLLLFYQYKEPAWTVKEHKKALQRFIGLTEEHDIQGRGRVAPEGVNCTLSSKSPYKMRSFCEALREWNYELFGQTDFKIVDGVPHGKTFKSLSIRKTNELVAYGMDGDEKAPSLQQFAGDHLEALEYHKALQDKDAVVIDVRNAYETAIGHFQPPPNGAKLIDPKLRNSIEWPSWLSQPETQKQLHGKKVLMYCTGGIRCERATALLNQMTSADPKGFCQPKGVYELRGGIERYLKTFPQGGFWSGKNYLFDRRSEQIPEQKSMAKVESEVESKCCLCRQKWTVYRGKFKCSQSLCGVPVIVCDSCRTQAMEQRDTLTCELCKEGYRLSHHMSPEALVELKRKAETLQDITEKGKAADDRENDPNKRQKLQSSLSNQMNEDTSKNKLFLSRLPLTITKSKLQDWLGKDIFVHWLTDNKTGAFFGACVVTMPSITKAQEIAQGSIPKLDNAKKKPRVSFANDKTPECPKDYKETEYPPVGYTN